MHFMTNYRKAFLLTTQKFSFERFLNRFWSKNWSSKLFKTQNQNVLLLKLLTENRSELRWWWWRLDYVADVADDRQQSMINCNLQWKNLCFLDLNRWQWKLKAFNGIFYRHLRKIFQALGKMRWENILQWFFAYFLLLSGTSRKKKIRFTGSLTIQGRVRLGAAHGILDTLICSKKFCFKLQVSSCFSDFSNFLSNFKFSNLNLNKLLNNLKTCKHNFRLMKISFLYSDQGWDKLAAFV